MEDSIKSLAPQSPEEYVTLVEALYDFFIRENVVGPSVYSLYVEEEKRPLIKGEPLREREIDPISTKNTHLQELLLSHFEREGEQMYGRTQFLVIFFALEVLLLNANFEDLNVLDLWKARFYYLYDKQMTSNVAHLQDKSLDFYEKYIILRD